MTQNITKEKSDTVLKKSITVNVYNSEGKATSTVEASNAVLNVELNIQTFSDIYTASKKTAKVYLNKSIVKGESEVSGGGRKPFKQKGTGNARQGSTRSLNQVGGGKFGRHETGARVVKVNKKQTFLLKTMVLSFKYNQGRVICLENLSLESHSSKECLAKISNLTKKLCPPSARKKAKVLMIHQDSKSISYNDQLATRNIQNIKVTSLDKLCSYDLTVSSYIFITPGVLEKLNNKA